MIKTFYSFGRKVVRTVPKILEPQLKPTTAVIKPLDASEKEISKKLQTRAQEASKLLTTDKSFKDLLRIDKDSSLKDISRHFEQLKKGASKLPKVSPYDKPDTFAIQEQKTNRLVEVIGIKDKDLAKSLVKEEFFLEREFLEEQIRFREQKKKQERQHELRELTGGINKLDWDHNFEKKDYVAPGTLDLPSQPRLIKDPTELQLFRTSQNIKQYLDHYFTVENLGFNIVLNHIETNESCTVVDIFWELSEMQKAESVSGMVTINTNLKSKDEVVLEIKGRQKKVQKKLQKAAGYPVTSEVTFVAILGQNSLHRQHSLKAEFLKSKQDIIETELVNQYQEGKISSAKISKKDYEKVARNIEDKIEQFSINEAVEVKEKPLKSSVKQPKKSRAEKFWDKL